MYRVGIFVGALCTRVSTYISASNKSYPSVSCPPHCIRDLVCTVHIQSISIIGERYNAKEEVHTRRVIVAMHTEAGSLSHY